METRNYEESRLLIKQNLIRTANETFKLAWEILLGKTRANLEDFNGRPMPLKPEEQAADLIRFALTLHPYSDFAHAHLGVLVMQYKVKPQLVDNLRADIFFSNDNKQQAAVYFRRALSCNPKCTMALLQLALLILSRAVTAEKSDFIDNTVPQDFTEQISTLIRRAQATDVGGGQVIIFTIGFFIQTGIITAQPKDFYDGCIPDTLEEQAAKIYRQVLTIDFDFPGANAYLASLIYQGKTLALASDYADKIVPATIPLQTVVLLRRSLIRDKETAETLLGMGRLYAKGEIVPSDEDSRLLGLNSADSVGEQSAALFRRVMVVEKTSVAARLELAELILNNKTKPQKSDLTDCNIILDREMHLRFMMREVEKLKPQCVEAKNLLQRMDEILKTQLQQQLARERVAWEKLDEERYQQRIAEQKKAAENVKKRKLSNPLLHGRTPALFAIKSSAGKGKEEKISSSKRLKM